jgi:hypothetical protein
MSAASVLAVAEKQRTLEEVVRALGTLGWALVEVVTQDEYTHDVVLPFAEHYLSFDTT